MDLEPCSNWNLSTMMRPGDGAEQDGESSGDDDQLEVEMNLTVLRKTHEADRHINPSLMNSNAEKQCVKKAVPKKKSQAENRRVKNAASKKKSQADKTIRTKKQYAKNAVPKKTKTEKPNNDCDCTSTSHSAQMESFSPEHDADIRKVFQWNTFFVDELSKHELTPSGGARPAPTWTGHFEFAGGGAAEVAAEALSSTKLVDVKIKTQSDWDAGKMRALQLNNPDSCKFKDIMALVESEAINSMPDETVVLNQNDLLTSLGVRRCNSDSEVSSSSENSSSQTTSASVLRTSSSTLTSVPSTDDSVDLEYLQTKLRKMFDKKHCLTSQLGRAQSGWELLGSTKPTTHGNTSEPGSRNSRTCWVGRSRYRDMVRCLFIIVILFFNGSSVFDATIVSREQL